MYKFLVIYWVDNVVEIGCWFIVVEEWMQQVVFVLVVVVDCVYYCQVCCFVVVDFVIYVERFCQCCYFYGWCNFFYVVSVGVQNVVGFGFYLFGVYVVFVVEVFWFDDGN